MTTILEFKELILSMYKKFERIIVPITKFIFAFIILSLVSQYMSIIDVDQKFTMFDKSVVKLALAALVAFVPATWFVLLLMVIVCARLFFVSLEAAFIVFCVVFVIYLMFVRLFPKQAYLVVLVPFLLHFKLAYILPILAGLFIGPATIVPVGVGVGIYFLSAYVPGLLEMTSADLYDMPTTVIEMYRYVMGAATADKAMMLMIGVFTAVILTTYFVSRLDMEYIQYIAIGAGGLVNIFGFIIGNIILDAGVKIIGVMLGTVLAVVIVGIMQFFRFSLDYQKSEKQQFEDDDYYYYVKAIPKIKIAKSKREVKTIE